MYLRTLETSVLKYMNLILIIFACTWTSMASLFKKDVEVESELLTNIDVIHGGKDIRGRICHSLHRYAKANNKYMKNYYKNINITHVFRCKQFV